MRKVRNVGGFCFNILEVDNQIILTFNWNFCRNIMLDSWLEKGEGGRAGGICDI